MNFSRRTFMKVAVIGGATLASDAGVKYVDKLVPYVKRPLPLQPVEWHTIATTCRECPAGCGMHILHKDGRITKAEGNPDHPVNRGGLCARGQSALQGIYDPDRVSTVHVRDRRGGTFGSENWQNAVAKIGERLQKANGRIAIVSRLETGTLAEIMTAFAKSFGSDRVLFYEAFHYGPLRKAHGSLFGRAVIPYYRLDQAQHILSFGADFLESWVSNVQFARQFSEMHELKEGKIGRFDYVGPRLSMTAANADKYVAVTPGGEKNVALAMLRIMTDERMIRAGGNVIVPLVRNADVKSLLGTSLSESDARTMARKFATSRSVALAGPVGASGPEADRLAHIVSLLNIASGSVGDIIDLSRPHALSGTATEEQLSRFLNSLTPDDVVIIHKTNPVYTWPGSEELLKKAGLIIYLGTMLDETASISDWYLPVHDDLESWGEYEPWLGVQSLIQPTMRTLTDSLDAGDLLIRLAAARQKVLRKGPAGSPVRSTADWLKQRWQSRFATADWEDSLRRGGTWHEFKAKSSTPRQQNAPHPYPSPLVGEGQRERGLHHREGRGEQSNYPCPLALPPQGEGPDEGGFRVSSKFHETHPHLSPPERKTHPHPYPSPSRGGKREGMGLYLREEIFALTSVKKTVLPLKQEEALLWLWPTVMLFDGRTANRGWIQEAPEPMSSVMWGSWIDIHPNKAKALGIRDNDVLELMSQNKRSVRAPARITQEVAEDAVAIAFGQGHTALGQNAAEVGVNAFALLPQAENFEGYFGRVTIRKTGKEETVYYGMTTKDQYERDLLRWKHLDEAKTMKPGPLILPLPDGYTRERDLYPPHKHYLHRWAMSIDLQRCIGCGACAVACYAENNLLVVGKHGLGGQQGFLRSTGELGIKGTNEGRVMAWLRIAPYRHKNDPLRIGFLPMPCQHCDAAPCEPVCPVFAAVNNEEGLNAQIYNRCIGTRYCSNNCPYKVRRFNWLNTYWKPPLDWQLNPEVTVRSRGVMEKCTFCVQRIRSAEYRAKRENRKVRDGEIQPACVQSCPAKVFTFGDLLDPDSKISKITRAHPRRYHVLEELNTKPAVTYLYRILQEK